VILDLRFTITLVKRSPGLFNLFQMLTFKEIRWLKFNYHFTMLRMRPAVMPNAMFIPDSYITPIAAYH
jgi:hypothetical protein